jgi:hypothetical protein
MTDDRRTPSFSYAVIQMGPQWRVVCARRAMGHFPSRDLALMAASSLAHEAVLAGHMAEILLQSETGELRVLWPDRP